MIKGNQGVCPPRFRSASMLIEVMLSMIAGSTVMVVAISVTHQCLLHGSRIRSQTNQTRALNSLASTFRNAVDSSEEVEVNETGFVALDPRGKKFDFKSEGQFVICEVSQGETILNRELFHVGQDTRCYVVKTNSRSLSLIATNPFPSKEEPKSRASRRSDMLGRTLLHVVAIVGRTKSLGTVEAIHGETEDRPE